jgi:DNA-binding response OmpR family regulator
MSQRTILVVDDDPRTVEIVRLRLERDGFRVWAAADGEAALAAVRARSPDLIVLDLMLPKIDGLDVCHILRAEHEREIPIIMLTARATEEDTLLGLDSGADDYLTKPFSPRELSARVQAVLRRAARADGGEPASITRGDLVVNPRTITVTRAGAEIHLTRTEFNLLATLIAEPDRAFTRLELIDRVFGYAYDGLERTIDVHVTNLRKKLEPVPSRPRYVQTVYGVGYRFCGGNAPDDDA